MPKPPVSGVFDGDRTSAPGLRYLIRARLVAFQDFSTPPASPGNGAGKEGDWNGGANGDASDDDDGYPPHEDDSSAMRDSQVDGTGDSSCNRFHPSMDNR